MTISLTDAQRRTFAALADVLIPEAEGMPAASQVQLEGAPLDQVLGLRPDLHEAFFRALDRAAGKDAAQVLEQLNRDDHLAIGAVGVVASAAYYMQPEVWRLLGYPGQTSRPAEPEEENDYMRDGLLQPVIDRGPVYRKAPD